MKRVLPVHRQLEGGFECESPLRCRLDANPEIEMVATLGRSKPARKERRGSKEGEWNSNSLTISRKAQAEMLEWFPRIIMMAVAVIVIVMLVRVYTNRDADAPDLHRAVYLYRLCYDDIIMYSDPITGRVYPGIVDVTKMTNKQLDDIFISKEPGAEWSRMSSRIIATPQSGCVIAKKEIYNNKATFDIYLGSANVKMAGGATKEVAVYPVTLRENGNTCAGKLEITIVRLNS